MAWVKNCPLSQTERTITQYQDRAEKETDAKYIGKYIICKSGLLKQNISLQPTVVAKDIIMLENNNSCWWNQMIASKKLTHELLNILQYTYTC